MVDVSIAIIGGGPAGLSAAIYALRAGHSVCICEGNATGGQMLLAHEIENYPGLASIRGVELADAMTAQAQALGATYRYRAVSDVRREGDVFLLTVGKETLTAHAVIVCAGTVRRKLGVENEDAYVGSGLSYCAVCDGRFYRDRAVAVIGGGNTAVGEALYLSKICRSVTLIHRRDSFRADKLTMDRLAQANGIRTLTQMRVDAIQGEMAVRALELVSTDPGKLSERMVLEVDGVFVAVGSEPDTAFLASFEGIERDDSGYLITDAQCRTAVPGLFAAGDIRAKSLRQISTAVSDGSIAGVEAAEFVDRLGL